MTFVPQSKYTTTQEKQTISHWRRQLRDTGARTPSTSNCSLFQVSSEPHERWHSTPLRVVACPVKQYSVICVYRLLALSHFTAYFCVLPLNYVSVVSCPLTPNPGNAIAMSYSMWNRRDTRPTIDFHSYSFINVTCPNARTYSVM